MFYFNEAYFGKTKDLLEIENLIQDLRDKYGTGRDVSTLNIGFGEVKLNLIHYGRKFKIFSVMNLDLHLVI